jgi:hypothetical protein
MKQPQDGCPQCSHQGIVEQFLDAPPKLKCTRRANRKPIITSRDRTRAGRATARETIFPARRTLRRARRRREPNRLTKKFVPRVVPRRAKWRIESATLPRAFRRARNESAGDGLNPDFCGRVWRRIADVEATDLKPSSRTSLDVTKEHLASGEAEPDGLSILSGYQRSVSRHRYVASLHWSFGKKLVRLDIHVQRRFKFHFCFD